MCNGWNTFSPCGWVLAMYQHLGAKEKAVVSCIKSALYTALVSDSFVVYEQVVTEQLHHGKSVGIYLVSWNEWPQSGMSICGRTTRPGKKMVPLCFVLDECFGNCSAAGLSLCDYDKVNRRGSSSSSSINDVRWD